MPPGGGRRGEDGVPPGDPTAGTAAAPPPAEVEPSPPPGAEVPAPEKGTRLVLVRHAQSVGNAEGIVTGHQGCRGLSALGVRQAEALAERLDRSGELRGAAALYTCVMARAVETAGIVAPAVGSGGLAAEQVCDLCEQHPGEADGLTWDEYVARYGAYSGRRAPDRPLSPGGESWLDLLGRADLTLRTIARRHAGQLVVIVTHGGVVDSSLVCLLGLPEQGAAVPAFRTWNASMTEWEHLGRGWALIHYNDAAHLTVGGLPTTR
jgi:probable phosphoglycerate mutase